MATVLQNLSELDNLLQDVRRKIHDIQNETIIEIDHPANTYDRIEKVRKMIQDAAQIVYECDLDRITHCSSEEFRATPHLD